MRAAAFGMIVVLGCGGAGCGARGWNVGLEDLPAVDLRHREAAVAHQLDEARLAVDRALADSGTSKAQGADAFETLGRLAFAHELYEVARVSFSNVTVLDPQRARSWYLLGLAYHELGHLDLAVDTLQRFLELEHGYGPALLRLGSLALERHELVSARQYFETAREDGAVRLAAVAGLGRVAFAAGELDRAISYFEEVLLAEPDAAALRIPLAAAYRQKGELEAARASLELGGEGKVGFVDPYLDELSELVVGALSLVRRGDRALEQGELEIAERHYRLALDADPELALAWFGLGLALTQQDEVAPSIAPFERAVELAPEHTAGWFNLATARLRLGQRDSARRAFDRVLEQDPAHVDALLRRAALRRDSGDLAGARADLEVILAHDELQPEALENLAPVLVRLGRRAEAEKLLEQRLGAAHAPAVVQGRLWVSLGLIAFEAGQVARAIERFAAATRVAPAHAPAWFNLAVAQVGTGQLAEAQNAFLAAARLDPALARAHRGAARCAIERGNPAEARELLEYGLEVVPASAELLRDLVVLLATSSESAVRDPERAVRLAREAFDAGADLGWAELVATSLVAAGRREEALEWQRRLVDQAGAAGAPSEVQARLRAGLRHLETELEPAPVHR